MSYDLKDLSEQMSDTFKRLDKAMCNIIKRLNGLKGLSEQIPKTFKQLDTIMRNLNRRLDKAMCNIIKRLIGKINYTIERQTPKHIPYQKRVY